MHTSLRLAHLQRVVLPLFPVLHLDGETRHAPEASVPDRDQRRGRGAGG